MKIRTYSVSFEKRRETPGNIQLMIVPDMKKVPVSGTFSIWRRNRDLNPGTVLPIYELSKPAPSTAWVFLQRFRMLNYITILFEKGKNF